jgi:hypothetical protein
VKARAIVKPLGSKVGRMEMWNVGKLLDSGSRREVLLCDVVSGYIIPVSNLSQGYEVCNHSYTWRGNDVDHGIDTVKMAGEL